MRATFTNVRAPLKGLMKTLCLIAWALIAGCVSTTQTAPGGVDAQPTSSSAGQPSELRLLLEDMLHSSFQAYRDVGLERLTQDSNQSYCSEAEALSKGQSQNWQAGPESGSASNQVHHQGGQEQLMQFERLQKLNQSLIWRPVGKSYFGDFRQGEVIAQDGRGKTWSDPANGVNGGNCYNCHQLSSAEVSYGTLGPSLNHYGKNRGINTVEDFERLVTNSSENPLVLYTWGILVNAKAFNACTAMPRFGVRVGADKEAILSERQIKDLMSLLIDPRSPVNQ